MEAKRDKTTTKRLKAKQIENLTTSQSQLFVANTSLLTLTATPTATATATALWPQQLPAPVALIGAVQARGSCANGSPRCGILYARLRSIGQADRGAGGDRGRGRPGVGSDDDDDDEQR